MQSELRNHLLDYFSEAADKYVEYIEPAFGRLAALLVNHANLESGETTIDMGTGSGLAARFAKQFTSHVFAFDFSHAMLSAAASQQTLRCFQADIHQLAISNNSFDVALAGFVFNSTDPRISFKETCRILNPGGRLIMHEWGTKDHLSTFLADTVAEYAVEEPSSELARVRRAADIPLPWDTLVDMDSLVDELSLCGFEVVEAEVINPEIAFQNVKQFINYKFAWPTRKAEIDAMPDEFLKLCLSDLEENFASYTNADDSLIWQPNVVRIIALKQV